MLYTDAPHLDEEQLKKYDKAMFHNFAESRCKIILNFTILNTMSFITEQFPEVKLFIK